VSKVPHGLPLDFYRRKWLHELPTGQQRTIPDLTSVAFLPDPSLSLFAKNHPAYDKSEGLSDRAFNKLHLGEVVKKYRMQEIIDDDIDEADKDDADEDGDDDAESDEEDLEEEEDDTYLADGDWGNHYDDDDDDDQEEMAGDNQVVGNHSNQVVIANANQLIIGNQKHVSYENVKNGGNPHGDSMDENYDEYDDIEEMEV
ncbi:hypothetical protein CROQUDRAFT_136966, partial [Cronartium quercuum f. sp. fusiforme G11]